MDTGPDSSYQHNQDGLIITAVVMTVIASTFVLMRSASRFVVIRNPGLDDYFMLAAMTLTICYVIMLFVLRHNHVGFPSSTLSADNLSAFIKTTLAIQVLYYTNVFCIKTSILLTYLRFAVTRTFRLLCLGTIFLHAIFFFICFVVTLAQCRPLYKMWTPFADGKCINTTAFFYSTSAFNIITDIWILCLPFRTLRKIQRPRRERVALYLIFSVGAFAATASIVRLHTIYIYTLSDDPSRDGIQVNLWSMIELTVAISCASVPALKPLFSRSQRAATRASRSKTFSTTTGSARSTSQGHYIHPGSSEPHVYPYSYEPPQAYEARQAYLEAHPDQNETTEKPTTTSAVCSPSSTTPAGGLSFFSPTTPAAAAAGLSFFSSASDEKDLEKEKEREKPHRPPLFDRENDHTESSGSTTPTTTTRSTVEDAVAGKSVRKTADPDTR
ncbi:hypothetical protein QBC47DRAFT_360341 [Echria macrotheca]|uniref:Rhodopsin domain-containing protein n=1 Tax=Echria macrotheca TaxID=438768 RepID=A0AAJ0BE35_9PEZI|nr:hypothetical protein QBC47DRAFT_360341 [Echria macrotheca]